MPKPRRTLEASALLAAPLVLLLAACGQGAGGGAGGAPDPDLPVTGTRWTVGAVTVDGTRSAAPEGTLVEFTADGRVRGSTGCNDFGAKAGLSGRRLTVGPVEVTEKGCPADRQRFEAAFLAALGGAPGGGLDGELKDGALTLASLDGAKRLELAAAPAVPPAPLRGTVWRIDGLVAKESVSSLPAGSGEKARFTVGADGRTTGNLGCNNFSAAAEVDERARTLVVEGPAATTRMMCASPQMGLETKLYALLDGRPLTYRIEGRVLTLTDASGEGLTARAEGAEQAGPRA
ncbi:META domain-containing protein [Streptomyces termitum]|uniref:Lipoprotein n=1 Tax=Streptomyces termitum TaxID=67368 RepID=A0A918WBA5_9ACTN|nr:META domain-containing protein [Streptomyces termitum]GHB05969.1 lipoprotein [Streptomyces termitum]